MINVPLWEYNCGLLQPTKMNEIDVAVMVDYVESFSTETKIIEAQGNAEKKLELTQKLIKTELFQNL